MGGHFDQLAAVLPDQFHNRAVFSSGTSTTRLSNGSSTTPSRGAESLAACPRNIVALAAHGLDEHGEVEDAASGHRELLGARNGLDAQGHVALQLLAAADRGGDGW